MSLSDPRQLIPAMEELALQLERWSRRMSDHLAETSATQRCCLETVERARARALSVRERALDDGERCTATRNEAERFAHSAAMTAADAERRRARAASTRNTADSTLGKWRGKLALAESRLAKARVEESSARAARDEAVSALKRADANLAAAENELSQARSRREYVGKDAKGQDVYRAVNLEPYKAAVAAARSDVDRASRTLGECDKRLAHAIAETRAAEAQVNACRQAVSYAERALTAATEAMTWGREATAAAALAQEDAARALATVAQASQLATEQASLSEEAMTRSQTSTVLCDQANTQLVDAELSGSSALDLSYSGRKDIDARLEALRAFNS